MDQNGVGHEQKPRNYFLEGFLELGRNWALAVAIAGASTAAYHTETVDGPVNWEHYVFAVGLAASVIWMFLAVVRFDEGLSRLLKRKSARVLGFLLYSLLITLGVALVVLVGKFSDNKAIVSACETYGTSPSSKVYKADECTRLREQRKALRDRLEAP
ncbi:hypothetical protein [Xanthomonas prunicola]|uniref:Uncharacterized protein n=1 Tax=Xanthomonas prunicola TaxID=2053930 RepID=A0A9Q9IZQ8_9XANT|nr:hypothetical protein [Xanthomonas prunicola]UXA66036.1 hypothetical protein M0D43_03045 [Xanthomonas prunicola]